MASRKNPAAVALGRRGGRVKSDAKTEAARANGSKGGRPEAPLNMFAIRAAQAVTEFVKSKSGDELFVEIGSREWLEQVARIIQRSHRPR